MILRFSPFARGFQEDRNKSFVIELRLDAQAPLSAKFFCRAGR